MTPRAKAFALAIFTSLTVWIAIFGAATHVIYSDIDPLMTATIK